MSDAGQLYTYPHMCRSDHIQIGHKDSEHERCPLCRTISLLQAAHEYLESDVADGFRPAERLSSLIAGVLDDVGEARDPGASSQPEDSAGAKTGGGK